VTTFQILSLDGGGFKGLYSAALLAKLEEDLNARIIDHFDLIVGTSTGGILAIALGLGFRPRELVEFYASNAATIFCKPWYAKSRLISSVPLLRRIAYLHGCFRPKYNADALANALKEQFGSSRLGDSKKRLVVPSFDLEQLRVHLFKTRHHARLKSDWKYSAWEVAMATASAPTFFRTASIEKMRLIDGGVWANNPTMVGIVEAIALLNQRVDSLKVLSVGTSYEVKEQAVGLDGGGYRHWLMSSQPPLIDVLMEGQSNGALGQAKNLLGEGRIHRLNTNAPKGLFALDRLNADSLMGRGIADARHASSLFEVEFMSHTAPAFEPIP